MITGVSTIRSDRAGGDEAGGAESAPGHGRGRHGCAQATARRRAARRPRPRAAAGAVDRPQRGLHRRDPARRHAQLAHAEAGELHRRLGVAGELAADARPSAVRAPPRRRPGRSARAPTAAPPRAASRDRRVAALGGHRVLGEVVGARRRRSRPRRANAVRVERERRHLDHDADLGPRGDAERRSRSSSSSACAPRGTRRAWPPSGTSPRSDAARRRAGSRAAACGTASRSRSERRMPRTPRNGLSSVAWRRNGSGLSAPASSVRTTTGRPSMPAATAVQELDLLVLRRRRLAVEEEELRAEQARRPPRPGRPRPRPRRARRGWRRPRSGCRRPARRAPPRRPAPPPARPPPRRGAPRSRRRACAPGSIVDDARAAVQRQRRAVGDGEHVRTGADHRRDPERAGDDRGVPGRAAARGDEPEARAPGRAPRPRPA